jgi:MFS family permease
MADDIEIDEGTRNEAHENTSKSSYSLQQATALVLLVVAQNVAVRLMNLPLNRLIESKYCYSYYSHHDPSTIPQHGDIPESLCKILEVQQHLAQLQGIIETIHIACDFVVTLPLAFLAKTIGLRSILIFNLVSLFLMWSAIVSVGLFKTLPVEYMAIAPLITIIGGGDCVFSSTIAAAIAHITPNTQIRTNLFAYTGSVNYVAILTGPALGAATMSLNIWLPFIIGLGLLVVAIPLTYYLPGAPSDEGTTAEQSPLMPRQANPSASTPPLFTLSFILLLLIFFLASFSSSNSPLLPMYISTRYQLSLAHAGYLLSAKALVNILLLTVIVPGSISYFQGTEPTKTNISGTQISMGISVLGAVLIAIATNLASLIPGLIIYALGSALPVFTMSLIKTFSDHTEAYSIAVLAKTAGTLVGLPTMVAVYSGSLGHKGWALGWIYWVSAMGFLAGLGVVVKLRRISPMDVRAQEVDSGN